MTYIKKNFTNNAECGLESPIEDNTTTIFLTGNYDRFPTANFVVEIATYDSLERVTARNNMYVTSRTGNQLTVTRSYEAVPLDYTSTSASTQALPFGTTGTVIRQVISKKFLEELQDEVALKSYDNEVVHKTGNETIAGTKTFTSSPIVPDTPAGGTSAVNANYVSGQIGTGNSFTLSENMTAGDVVKIINNGEIEKIYPKFSDEATFQSGRAYNTSAVLIDTNKVFIAYKYNNFGYGVVANISGNTITYGNTNVFEFSSNNYISVVKLNTNKVFIGYKNVSDSYGYGIVATIASSNITYGTKVVFHSFNVDDVSVAGVDTDKVLISFRGNNNYLYGKVATVSGSTISYGTEISPTGSSIITNIKSIQITTNKVFLAYNSSTGGTFGRIVTISGTSQSYGTEDSFSTNAAGYFDLSLIDTNKILLSGEYLSGNRERFLQIISMYNTTIGYGAQYIYKNSGNYAPSKVVKLDINKANIIYDGFIREINVIGSYLYIGNEEQFNTINTSSEAAVQLETEKILISYYSNNSNSIVKTEGYVKLAGIIQNSGTTGQLKLVKLLGSISDIHSGLTPGDELDYGTVASSTEIMIHRNNI